MQKTIYLFLYVSLAYSFYKEENFIEYDQSYINLSLYISDNEKNNHVFQLM